MRRRVQGCIMDVASLLDYYSCFFVSATIKFTGQMVAAPSGAVREGVVFGDAVNWGAQVGPGPVVIASGTRCEHQGCSSFLPQRLPLGSRRCKTPG
jgi:hypothetical protein